MTLAKNVMCRAYAGTGKTFQLIQGLHLIKNGKTNSVVGSDEQQAIWDEFQRGDKPATFKMVAFNNSIVDELNEKLPTGVTASTLHSAGNSLLRGGIGRKKPHSFAMWDLMEEVVGRKARDIRKDHPNGPSAIIRLVGLCKQTLTGWNPENGFDAMSISDKQLDVLVRHYSLVVDVDSTDFVYDTTRATLEKCALGEHYKISFDDMIWLPVIHNLSGYQVDFLAVDECQDLNRMQQELAYRLGRRIISVGDSNQAIYGFAGADTRSMDRLSDHLTASKRGLGEYRLTETRRCGHAITAHANHCLESLARMNEQKFIPMRSHESCPAGEILNSTVREYTSMLVPGDMVLSRVNAPLVSQCLRLIASGVTAAIRGRDIGSDLADAVKRTNQMSAKDCVAAIHEWGNEEIKKEEKKKYPSESRIQTISDKVMCIDAISDGMRTSQDMLDRIKTLFDDNRKAVTFSSIHRAKGLEADNVFLLVPHLLPHPMAKTKWERVQEMNLRYVAITRAKNKFVSVEGEPMGQND